MVELKPHNNTVKFNTENFSVESSKTKKEGITLKGIALPFDKTSRNGFSYRTESVKKSFETMRNKPMFFNHEVNSVPIGRVEDVRVTDRGLEYTARLKPVTQEGKDIATSVQEGLIDKVSIHCIYENATYNEEEDKFEVDVKEFLELSVVGIPGFEDTTAQAFESLNTELQKQKEEVKTQEEEIKEENSTEEDSNNENKEEYETEEEKYCLKEEYNSLFDKVNYLENTVTNLQATMDSMLEKEENNEEANTPQDDNQEETFERVTEMPSNQEKKSFDLRAWKTQRRLNI